MGIWGSEMIAASTSTSPSPPVHVLYLCHLIQIHSVSSLCIFAVYLPINSHSTIHYDMYLCSLRCTTEYLHSSILHLSCTQPTHHIITVSISPPFHIFHLSISLLLHLSASYLSSFLTSYFSPLYQALTPASHRIFPPLPALCSLQ